MSKAKKESSAHQAIAPGTPPGKPSLHPHQCRHQSGLDPLLTREARKWLIRLGCESLADRVEVVWNSRLQTTAGAACVKTFKVELNPRLHQIGEHQINRTLRHEVAHLIAHVRAGRRARSIQTHGPEWRIACADLGIAGEPAFHDLPFERRTIPRKLTYQCPHCGLIVHRVRKFSRFTACYRCCKKFNEGQYSSKYQFRFVSMLDRK